MPPKVFKRIKKFVQRHPLETAAAAVPAAQAAIPLFPAIGPLVMGVTAAKKLAATRTTETPTAPTAPKESKKERARREALLALAQVQQERGAAGVNALIAGATAYNKLPAMLRRSPGRKEILSTLVATAYEESGRKAKAPFKRSTFAPP